MHEHHERLREAERAFHAERAELRREGVRLSAADYLARAEELRERHARELRRIHEQNKHEIDELRESRRK